MFIQCRKGFGAAWDRKVRNVRRGAPVLLLLLLTVHRGHTTPAEGAAPPAHFLLPAVALVPAVSAAAVTSQLGLTLGI